MGVGFFTGRGFGRGLTGASTGLLEGGLDVDAGLLGLSLTLIGRADVEGEESAVSNSLSDCASSGGDGAFLLDD